MAEQLMQDIKEGIEALNKARVLQDRETKKGAYGFTH